MGFQDADTASLGELDGGFQELGLPHSGRRLDDDDAALGMIGQAGHAIDQETEVSIPFEQDRHAW